MTDEDLHELFAEFGTVESARIITDRETGRSRGFGFVEMPDDAAAQTAIESLNGREVQGRNLNVNEARPREPRSGGGFRR
jgi:RNA recognition motif-containing protein